MYDTLLDLPLFRGASRDRITDTVGKAKFHFLKFEPGDKIVGAGQPCSHLMFILAGQVEASMEMGNGKYTCKQYFRNPDVLYPDFLFGRDIHFPASVTAISTTNILQIEKADYLHILKSDSVFLLNFLNFLSINSQKALSELAQSSDANPDKRIAFRILGLTRLSANRIVISTSDGSLSQLFGVTIDQLQSFLSRMKEKRILDFESGQIEIWDRKALIDLLNT